MSSNINNTFSTTGSGPAPNTEGPHKSDMLNRADPRVDSDRARGRRREKQRQEPAITRTNPPPSIRSDLMGSPEDPVVPPIKEKEELPPTWADRVWNSRPREVLFESAQTILEERPILGLFILFQVFFGAIPILLFLGFSILVVCVTLLAASGFILFWIALALALGLIPALLFTTIVATTLFAFTADRCVSRA
jgi:hypothetical protein